MGDRVSIAFRCEGEDSVVLFNHWGGKEFATETAMNYAQELFDEIKKLKKNGSGPLDRFEPNTVMIDFIRHINKKWQEDGRIRSSLYLGATENDGDNSDNGHFVIEFTKDKVKIH